MADTVENVLVSLKLDLPATATSIKELTADVLAFTKAVRENHEVTGNANLLREQMIATAQRQEQALKKNTEAVKAEEGSIASLRKENAELTKQRNAISVATEDGRKKVEALNKELDANNATIKENVDQYTKQKIGIGGYSDALDKLVPGLGATTTGIMNATKAALAFMATGLGLVLAALGLALGAVVKYFNSSEEAQNRWNKVVQYGSAILEVFWNIVEGAGEAIVNFFTSPMEHGERFYNFVKDKIIGIFNSFMDLVGSLGAAIKLVFEGEFSQAADVAGAAIKKVADGVVDMASSVINGVKNIFNEVVDSATKAIAMAEDLADVQAAIDEKERTLIVERAKTQAEVARLRSEAIKQEGADKEETIRKAIALEQELADEEVKQAQRRLEEAQLKLKISGDDKDAKLAVAEAEAAVILAEAGRYEATLRFEKELETMRDAQEAKRLQQIEDRKKKDKETEDAAYDAMERAFQAQLKRDAEKLKKDKEAAEAQKRIEAAKNEALIGMTNMLTQRQSAARVLLTSIFKKDALKQATINAKEAAIAAYKSAANIPFVGWILAPIAGAAAALYGMTQVADIAGISFDGFAKGGRVPRISGQKISAGHGIPITRSNGDDLLVTAKRGEVILNEYHQAALGGDATFRRLGIKGFADSGVIGASMDTRVAMGGMDAMMANRELVQAILNQPPPVLVQQDYEYEKFKSERTAARAVVISGG